MFTKKLLERCLVQVVPKRNLVINVDQLYDNKVYKLHLLDEGPSHTTELTKTDALKYYEQMDEIRKVENSIAQLYRQKKIRGFCHLYVGQEAVAVGISSVMRPQDTVITSYRCHGWAVLKCESISSVIAELIGKCDYPNIPKHYFVLKQVTSRAFRGVRGAPCTYTALNSTAVMV